MSKSLFLDVLDAQVKQCKMCNLCSTRTKTVFGEGNENASIMFVGEGPGADEDASGRPFVGRAGQLLDKWIAVMGLTRQDVYIGNIVKCRPPNNRVPEPDEVAACVGYLDAQIDVISPKVIILLGATALKALFKNPKASIMRERGKVREYKGIKVVPTFHPAFLLRQMTEENKSLVKEDLATAKEIASC